MSRNQDVLHAKLRIGYHLLPHMGRGLRLVWAAAPGWTAAWLALLIIQGVLPVTIVRLTRVLVNELAVVLVRPPSWESFALLLPYLVAMVALLLLVKALTFASDYVRSVQGELVRDHIAGLIQAKSLAVDMAFYDSSDYYDRLYRAQYQAIDRPQTLLQNFGSVLQNAITLVGMVFVLIPYGILPPLALLASSLPALYVVFKHRLRWHQWRLKNTESERRTWYYDWVLTDREAAAELRIFDLGQHFKTLFDAMRGKLRGERTRLAWDQGLAELGAGVIALGISGAAMGLMLWRAMLGILTLGDLALFYQAFQQVQGGVTSLFENLGEIYSNSLFLSDLFEFLSLEPQITAPPTPAAVPAPLQTGIRFEQVTFHYPNSKRVALRNFNLAIPPHGIVAIVGANGAGKSTLIKLLCRFYDPDEGRVLLDGVDLRALDPRELRRQITILFQEPVHYQNTAAENITFGDMAAEVEMQRVIAAAQAAGAASPIDRLPQGYETQLGNWFKGGAELSVGEWQRLALARAYWRRAPILILDEPTSAMDPWAEHDWLQRFRALAADSMALIITHRFTTAMHADVIYVLDGGQVVESGSHTELLERGGRYAQSWGEQMRVSAEASPNENRDASAPLRSGSDYAEAWAQKLAQQEAAAHHGQ